MKRSIRRIGGALVLVVVAAACSGSDAASTSAPTETTARPSTTPVASTTAPNPTSTTTPPGLERHDGDGYSVLLPAGWTILDADDVAMEQLLEESAEVLDASMVAAIGAMFEQGGKIFAFDFADADPSFVTNINILEAPLPPFPIDAIETITAEQLESVLGASVVDSQIRTTAAGEVVVVRYLSPETDSQGISATLLTETTQWAITLSARDVGPFVERFDAIVDSFAESR